MTSDTTFAELGVSKPVVAALADKGIEYPFPIQQAVIDDALGGRDICGRAPTGSGKTLAFGIPVVERCAQATAWHPSALILSPTRELASQIREELEPLARARGRSLATVFGGTNIERDIRQLRKGVDILIACPGRLEDLMSRQCCDLRDVGIVVVDEADRMCDMGFLPSVKRILDCTPDNRHTMLFSATLDKEVGALIERYQDDPSVFEVESPVEDAGDVEHSWYLVQPATRIDAAAQIIASYWSTIVFCRTRRGCDRIAKQFTKRGLAAVAIHGDRSQPQRERALRDFTEGRAQVLVATDVAARGIHVDNVELVLHYDPAGTDKDYIHRSGRTGRAGSSGRVISLIVPERRSVAKTLQRELGHPRGLDDLSPGEFTGEPDPNNEPPPPPPEPTRSRNDRGGAKRGGDTKHGGNRGSGNRGGDSKNNRGRSKNNGDRDDRGGTNSRNDRSNNSRDHRGGSDNRGRSNNDRSNNDRSNNDRYGSKNNSNRDDRQGRSDRGGSNSRNDRGRSSNDRYGSKKHSDRDDRGGYGKNDRGGSKKYRNRDDRGKNSRDDRGGSDNRGRSKNTSYGSKNNSDRDDRGGSKNKHKNRWADDLPGDKRGGNHRGSANNKSAVADRQSRDRSRIRRSGTNDWYPPGWEDDERSPGRPVQDQRRGQGRGPGPNARRGGPKGQRDSGPKGSRGGGSKGHRGGQRGGRG